jgi:ATP-dependent DNA helicase RecG
VTEALVNALIHRDYIVLGSEIHIDMCDDRVQISSPGGMYNSGKVIQEQDIESLRSERRNPVIADLIHRMKYMEQRRSGLKKIINKTKKLSGYRENLKPVFLSTTSSLVVVLKNVNFTSDQETSFGINFGTNFGINEPQQNILVRLAANPAITAQTIADEHGVTRRTVENHIKQFKKLGLVERAGARKNGRWLVNTTGNI